MRVVLLEAFGPPESLHVVEAPDPRPGPGQVVVQVEVAGITFVETQIRAGRPPWPGPGPSLPIVLGNGVGGKVVAAGDGVAGGHDRVGERVVTATGGSGGYAERVVVDAGEPFVVADGLSLAEAVALLADGRTALALARAASIGSRDRVLITAAGGGVGSLLVQLARRCAGATVIAVAGGQAKLALAQGLGADVTVDYRQPGWASRVRSATGGTGVEVAFDGVGGELGREVVDLMASAGRMLVYGAAGRLRPTIGQTFPLERAAEAHAAIEARSTIGKTLLVP